MKILLWHGYLLGGTGSNVYTRSLARAWSRLGHEVVVFCQDPDPARYDVGGARVVRRAQQAGGEGEEAMLVPVDQLLERPAVALLRPGYERSVRIIHA